MEFILASYLILSPDPPLADRDRFPMRELAREAMQFNRAYRRHVENRQAFELHNWWYWQEVLTETDYLYHTWDWLHAAQGGEGRDEVYWRHSLLRLRELLGDEAYFTGVMPPAAPVWRFRYVD